MGQKAWQGGLPYNDILRRITIYITILYLYTTIYFFHFWHETIMYPASSSSSITFYHRSFFKSCADVQRRKASWRRLLRRKYTNLKWQHSGAYLAGHPRQRHQMQCLSKASKMATGQRRQWPCTHPRITLSITLSIYHSIYLSLYLSITLSIYLASLLAS